MLEKLIVFTFIQHRSFQISFTHWLWRHFVIDLRELFKVFWSKVFQNEWSFRRVKDCHQLPIELGSAVKLQFVSIWVSREFVAFTLEEQYLKGERRFDSRFIFRLFSIDGIVRWFNWGMAFKYLLPVEIVF